MDKKSQAKNALVGIINAKLDKLGWKQGDLAKASGVGQSTLSRFLKSGRGMSANNIIIMLITLNLLKDGNEPISKKDEQLKYNNLYKENVELLKDYRELSKEHQKLLTCFLEREDFVKEFQDKEKGRRKCDKVNLTPLKKTL